MLDRDTLDTLWNPEGLSSEECWTHRGNPRPDGYRTITKYIKSLKKNQVFYVHRLAWEIYNGPIPEGLEILHKCDNRACSNPAHLYIGTQSDNMCDMIERRKPNTKLGRTAYKFTPDDLETIKNLREEGMTQQMIADRFKCSREYIGLLLKGKRGENIKYR